MDVGCFLDVWHGMNSPLMRELGFRTTRPVRDTQIHRSRSAGKQPHERAPGRYDAQDEQYSGYADELELSIRLLSGRQISMTVAVDKLIRHVQAVHGKTVAPSNFHTVKLFPGTQEIHGDASVTSNQQITTTRARPQGSEHQVGP